MSERVKVSGEYGHRASLALWFQYEADPSALVCPHGCGPDTMRVLGFLSPEDGRPVEPEGSYQTVVWCQRCARYAGLLAGLN
jgi:hypothetical protein